MKGALTRRTFLTRLAQGAAVAVVFAHVPVEWVPRVGGLQRYAAANYLRAEFNKRARGGMRNCLELLVVGRDLFEAVESDVEEATFQAFGHRCLFTRQNVPNSIMFKGAALTYRGRGWKILYMGKMDRAQYDS